MWENWKCKLKQKTFQAVHQDVSLWLGTPGKSACSQGRVFFRNQTTISSLVFQSLEIRANGTSFTLLTSPSALTLRSKGTEWGGHHRPRDKSSAPFLKVSCDFCQCSEWLHLWPKRSIVCHFLSALGLQSPRTPKYQKRKHIEQQNHY